MAGEIQRRRYRRHSPYLARTRLDNAILVLMGIVAALFVALIALTMLESTLKRIDRVNQEQIIWRCNGNGGADQQCLPIANA